MMSVNEGCQLVIFFNFFFFFFFFSESTCPQLSKNIYISKSNFSSKSAPPTSLMKQKINHILIWILKKLKKKKLKFFKKSACGDSRPFASQIKTVSSVTFLFIKRFKKTLCQNVHLDEF